jgi:hypothetical protein
MSYIIADTYTYSTADIATVVRRFAADMVMIAQSTAAITEARARDYAHDVEVLAKEGYLDKVDLTLISGAVEVRATQYVADTAAGGLVMSRPGGVMWPRVPNPELRIILYYTNDYTQATREAIKKKLKIGWVPTDADTSHTSLMPFGNRDYASNGWGMRRKDFAA